VVGIDRANNLQRLFGGKGGTETGAGGTGDAGFGLIGHDLKLL
jgi:hypothetical protein